MEAASHRSVVTAEIFSRSAQAIKNPGGKRRSPGSGSVYALEPCQLNGIPLICSEALLRVSKHGTSTKPCSS